MLRQLHIASPWKSLIKRKKKQLQLTRKKLSIIFFKVLTSFLHANEFLKIFKFPTLFSYTYCLFAHVLNHFVTKFPLISVLSSILRSSCSQKFFKIGILKNFDIFTGKHLACNFIKKETPTKVVSCKYIAIL